MEFTGNEDDVLLDQYFGMTKRTSYTGVDLWVRIAAKMHDECCFPPRSWNHYKSRVDHIINLGVEGMTFDERYFNDNGSYFSDDFISEEGDGYESVWGDEENDESSDN